MRPKKKGKASESKSLTLKVRREIWEKWKILSAKEETTMSEIAERLIAQYSKKKGV